MVSELQPSTRTTSTRLAPVPAAARRGGRAAVPVGTLGLAVLLLVALALPAAPVGGSTATLQIGVHVLPSDPAGRLVEVPSLELGAADLARGWTEFVLPLRSSADPADATPRLLHLEPLAPLARRIEVHGLGLPLALAPEGLELAPCTRAACPAALVLRIELDAAATRGRHAPPVRARWLPAL